MEKQIEEINMRYKYGTNDSYSEYRGRTATAKQIASLIKRDVEYGKWNIYHGGVEDSFTASCSYERKGFVYHERLYIQGTEREFKELEALIKDFIEVIPRKFIYT